MHEEIDINNYIEEEFNYGDANYYDSLELDYYKPDAFNQPENLPDTYYVKDPKEYECQYYRSYFFLNNKLYSHLQGNCNRWLDNSISQKNNNTTHAFSSVIDLLVNLKSIDISQDISVKNTHIIYFTIKFFINIGTGYSFCGYHYLKSKIALSLSSSVNSLCFDTSYSIILCDVVFFFI